MAARDKRKNICLMDTERTDTKEEEIDQPMDTNPELKHREANKPKRGRKKNIKQIYKEGSNYNQVHDKAGTSKDTRDEVEENNAAPDGVGPNSEGPEGAEPNNKEPDSGRMANQEEIGARPTNEEKDEHELFSMPDKPSRSVAYDLGKSIDVPGDLATLRQKHRDGMYQSLEEFKKDVLNVFNKALESNAPDTIPYQEAKSLQDQANQIFRYLRSNPLYAEKELANWHQKYFKYKKKPAKFEKSPGIFKVEILESRLRPRAASNMKQKNAVNDDASNRRAQSSRTKKNPKQRVGSSKTYDPQDFEKSNSPIEDRRNTYKPENNSFDEIASMAFQPMKLVRIVSYEESLRKFVKDAGPVAKLLAEKKIQELAEQTQAYQASKYEEFSKPQMISQMPQIGDWSKSNKLNADPTNISLLTESYLPGNSASPLQSNSYAAMFDSTLSVASATNYFNICSSEYPDNSFAENLNSVQGASCELHTDDLVNWFSKIGTPEFLQGSISNMETSSMGASESALGVNSQLLYGEGSQAVVQGRYPGYASSVTLQVLMTHTNRSSELKQPEFSQKRHVQHGTKVQGRHPGYASSVAADSMTQINRSSDLKTT
ncbi:uncharacterized protein LOC120265291 [Dioscorea cayenensis subsp. rotundata]|uniref:Uncharacterized protein LOC120265291 n=1 Tax=Dioscorea cayennensis subsp. rotundata TaxID=55577 RepID=A0AB40BNX4_DIOCR|nr:uncharacterized protein LOC120265291 [Dioscorea cayenensis subsp. rotundata]